MMRMKSNKASSLSYFPHAIEMCLFFYYTIFAIYFRCMDYRTYYKKEIMAL